MTVGPFGVPPKKAIEWFERKGRNLKPTLSYRDMAGAAHNTAFTVAKMLDTDLLRDVHKAVREMLEQGLTMKDAADRLIPKLQEKGWWGKKTTIDPATGEETEVQLGSPRRLETIFRTNLMTAYAAGLWDDIQEGKEDFPYLKYTAVDDGRTRAQHRDWDGLVLSVDDPFWKVAFPPNGFNCRCSVIQVSERRLARMGKDGPDPSPSLIEEPRLNPRTGKTEVMPRGIDPGWNYNPGIDQDEQLEKMLGEKTAQAEEELGLEPGSIDSEAGREVAPPEEEMPEEQPGQGEEMPAVPEPAETAGAGEEIQEKSGPLISDAGDGEPPRTNTPLMGIGASEDLNSTAKKPETEQGRPSEEVQGNEPLGPFMKPITRLPKKNSDSRYENLSLEEIQSRLGFKVGWSEDVNEIQALNVLTEATKEIERLRKMAPTVGAIEINLLQVVRKALDNYGAVGRYLPETKAILLHADSTTSETKRAQKAREKLSGSPGDACLDCPNVTRHEIAHAMFEQLLEKYLKEFQMEWEEHDKIMLESEISKNATISVSEAFADLFNLIASGRKTQFSILPRMVEKIKEVLGK